MPRLRPPTVADVRANKGKYQYTMMRVENWDELAAAEAAGIDMVSVSPEMMVEKQFRSDLYYRLKVFPITTPPLRERPEDIPVLARHFTRKYAEKMGRTIDKIPSETMRALQAWQWPGNVRELENFIERAVILSVGPNLRAPISEIREASPQTEGTSSLEQVERDHILRILRETNGVITTAATRLGLHRTTLNAMMRKLGISRKDL